MSTATIQVLLDTILKSRLQRKAKGIILSSIQFIAVDFALLLTYLEYDLNGENNNNAFNPTLDVAFKITLYIAAIYTALLSLFIFIHSVLFLKTANTRTVASVEKAYSRTNLFPLVDGILELPFPFIFRGYAWFLPYFCWVIYVGVVGIGFLFFYLMNIQLTMTTLSTLVAGVLLLYQITSDFSEYWVQSRHRESMTDDDSVVSGGIVVSDNNDRRSRAGVGSYTAPGTIAAEEGQYSSAGFTRLS